MSRVERFSQRARRILTGAQDEAEKLRNSTIETPHLLLAMLRVEDSVAYQVLTDLKIDYTRVLAAVQAAHPSEPTPPTALELAPETKRVLESAIMIARERNDQQVGSEHLLLALIKGEDKSIRYLIRQINLEPSVVRSCVERVLQKGGDKPADTKPFTQGSLPLEESESAQEFNPRAKVLQMVEFGTISAAEGAELLKAMRFAALPVPASSGFVLLPLDDVNFDALRQRTLRFVVTGKDSEIIKAELTLPFLDAQSELFRLLSEIYSGSQGTLLDLDGDQDHLQISLE